MTALTPTDIPSGINTLEQLAMWAISALSHTNGALVVVEGQGVSEQASQAGTFYIPASNKYRFLGRVSLEITSDYLTGSQKPWKFAQELSTNTLSPTFKTN